MIASQHDALQVVLDHIKSTSNLDLTLISSVGVPVADFHKGKGGVSKKAQPNTVIVLPCTRARLYYSAKCPQHRQAFVSLVVFLSRFYRELYSVDSPYMISVSGNTSFVPGCVPLNPTIFKGHVLPCLAHSILPRYGFESLTDFLADSRLQGNALDTSGSAQLQSFFMSPHNSVRAGANRVFTLTHTASVFQLNSLTDIGTRRAIPSGVSVSGRGVARIQTVSDILKKSQLVWDMNDTAGNKFVAKLAVHNLVLATSNTILAGVRKELKMCGNRSRDKTIDSNIEGDSRSFFYSDKDEVRKFKRALKLRHADGNQLLQFAPLIGLDPGVKSIMHLVYVPRSALGFGPELEPEPQHLLKSFGERDKKGVKVLRSSAYTMVRRRHEVKGYREQQLRLVHKYLLRPDPLPPDQISSFDFWSNSMRKMSIAMHETALKNVSTTLCCSTRTSDFHLRNTLQYMRAASVRVLSRFYGDEIMYRRLKFNSRMNTHRSMRQYAESIPVRLGLNVPLKDVAFVIGIMSGGLNEFRGGNQSTPGTDVIAKALLDAGAGTVTKVFVFLLFKRLSVFILFSAVKISGIF